MMMPRHRAPLDGASMRAALGIWLEGSENAVAHSGDPWPGSDPLRMSEEDSVNNVDGVRSEAEDILHVLLYADLAPCSPEELRDVFAPSSTRVSYLAEAVAAGGATGRGCWDASQMLSALRSASDEGSFWAPLWLGDLEFLWQPDALECAAEFRRERYLEAAARGHPDAEHRLASMPQTASGPSPCFAGMTLADESWGANGGAGIMPRPTGTGMVDVLQCDGGAMTVVNWDSDSPPAWQPPKSRL